MSSGPEVLVLSDADKDTFIYDYALCQGQMPSLRTEAQPAFDDPLPVVLHFPCSLLITFMLVMCLFGYSSGLQNSSLTLVSPAMFTCGRSP